MQGLVIMTFNLRRKRQKMHGNFELKEFIIWIFPLPHLSVSLSLSLSLSPFFSPGEAKVFYCTINGEIPAFFSLQRLPS